MRQIHLKDSNGRETKGRVEEELFVQCATKYLNVEVKKATYQEDRYLHIDFHLSNGWKVDVKSQKAVNWGQPPSQTHTWVELRNKAGGNGWIDGKATHIVFAYNENYIVVDREILRQHMMDTIIDWEIYWKKGLAEDYKIYQRPGLFDKICLVPIKDILALEHTTFTRDE